MQFSTLRRSVVTLLVLLVAFVYAGAAEYESGEFVSSLTTETFDDFVKENQYVLIEFFAPWCPHCKSLAKPYAEAAKILNDEDSPVKLADVNCEQNNEICTKFQIPGFPTLKLFKDGTPFKDYEDGRTASDIVNFLRRKTGPAAVPLEASGVSKFVKANPDRTVVVGYFKDVESEEAKTFSNVAADLDDFTFAIVKSTENKVDVHSYFTDKVETTTDIDTDALTAFINEKGVPLVEEVNGKTFKKFVDAGLPLVVMFLKFDEKKQSTIDILNKAAENLKGRVSFGYSDSAVYSAQYESMGGDTTKIPGVAAMDIQKRTNYPYSGELNAEEIEKWATGIADGTVKPFFKSQPIPEDNNGPVKVVVGKSFNDIVYDTDKDVLVEFYAPWCGHCKKLAPIYEKLGEYFQNVDNLVIANIDSTENDVPDVPVEGFPTILFFPSDNKKNPIPFEGERTLSGFKKFLKDSAVASKKNIIETLKAKKAEKLAKEKESKDEL